MDALEGVMEQASAPQVTIDDMMEGVEFGVGDEKTNEKGDEVTDEENDVESDWETDEESDWETDEQTDEEDVDMKEEESAAESEGIQGARASATAVPTWGPPLKHSYLKEVRV